MRFLVQIAVSDMIAGREADRQFRDAFGPHVQQVMASGKVREAGFLTDRRGAFFLVDIEAAEELYALFGPEVYGTCRVQAAPIATLEQGAALFQQWAQDGR
jgi:hypothetical protein